MKKIQVYDLPTRIFHWLFVGFFVGAFFISKVYDNESVAYPYHMLLGFLLTLTVVWRVFWGFFGSRYARFSSFSLSPTQLIVYFKNLVTGRSERELGHNPASSWTALIMIGLALGLGITGYLMTSGNKETFEDIHELFANAFVIVAIAHVCGIILHTFRHRDSIGLSMIHGKKDAVEGTEGIGKTHIAAGLIFLTLIGAFVFYLNKNYDPGTQSLNLFGNTLQLGESEDGEHESKGGGEDDDDDDD